FNVPALAVDATPPDARAVDCVGTAIIGAGGTPASPAVYDATQVPLLEVPGDRAGCVYTITVDGAGGGRGNHDTPPDNADGGSGGRIVFEFVPGRAGAFTVVIGGGGTGEVTGTDTLDDPGPGAGGGGASQVTFTPLGEPAIVLAVAGGGGGGGWAERGSDGGGGDGECGAPADEGS